MASEIRVPELGESVVEATVAEWLKAEGDAVKTGEAIVRLETDKVDVEVSAEGDGVLGNILRQQGEDVRVGEVLGSIEPAGSRKPEAAGGAAAPPEPPQAKSSTLATLPAEGGRGDGEGDRVPAGRATAQAAAAVEGETARANTPAPAVTGSAAPQSDEGKTSPLARRVADELGVDLSQVPAGPSGRITREDVEAFAASRRAEPAARPAAEAPRAAAPTEAQPAPASAPPSTRPQAAFGRGHLGGRRNACGSPAGGRPSPGGLWRHSRRPPC